MSNVTEGLGMELLAPAGNMDAFYAAIGAGADAVYLGLGTLNARRNAGNLTFGELEEACRIAHLAGRRVYLTANTLVLDNEFEDALDLLARAYNTGVDAAIIQDLGLLTMVADAAPQLELHVSTQMNAHDAGAIRTARDLGASRVTLAREMSLAELPEICSQGVEIEVFAHGALCICYSGQCLMSSVIGQRSANRGLCAQPCRLPYELVESRGDASGKISVPGPHLLSPKDLCTIDILPSLIETGVASLKIEGRMKAPEYVATVTSVYRSCIDRALDDPDGYRATDEERGLLAEAFSRGFTTAYLEDERGNGMMSYQRPNNRGVLVGRVIGDDSDGITVALSHPVSAGDVLEFWTRKGRVTHTVEMMRTAGMGGGDGVSFAASGDEVVIPVSGVRRGDRAFRVRSSEIARRSRELSDIRHGVDRELDFVVRAHLDEPLHIEVRDSSGNSGSFEGAVCESARTKALTEDDVVTQVGKLGNTPYAVSGFSVDLEDGIGMGFSQLHRARNGALGDYERNLLEPWASREPLTLSATAPGSATVHDLTAGPRGDVPEFAIITASRAVAATALERGAVVYVPALEMARWDDPGRFIALLPTIAHERETSHLIGIAERARSVVCDSAWMVARCAAEGLSVEAGPRCNLLNSYSFSAINGLGASRCWVSPELSLDQIEQLVIESPVPLTMTVRGAAELMITEHCELMAEGECDGVCGLCERRRKRHVLVDKKGYGFPVVTDASGRSHVYNSVPLDLLPFLDRIAPLVSRVVLDATLLDEGGALFELGELEQAVRALGSPDVEPPARIHGATTGHLFRGVL